MNKLVGLEGAWGGEYLETNLTLDWTDDPIFVFGSRHFLSMFGELMVAEVVVGGVAHAAKFTEIGLFPRMRMGMNGEEVLGTAAILTNPTDEFLGFVRIVHSAVTWEDVPFTDPSLFIQMGL